MVAEFVDSVTGAPVYINLRYVTTFRPDPADPTKVTLVKLEDGESIRVRGEHVQVADKLAKAA
jgi:hypothetical protein